MDAKFIFAKRLFPMHKIYQYYLQLTTLYLTLEIIVYLMPVRPQNNVFKKNTSKSGGTIRKEN